MNSNQEPDGQLETNLQEPLLNEQADILKPEKISFLIYEMLAMSLPMTLTLLLDYLGTVVGLMFSGHVKTSSNEEHTYILAGFSIGTMFGNITGFSILIGMSSAVETLAAQYNGAGDYKMVGSVLQRSIAILGVLSLPIALIWNFTESILLSVGQNSEAAAVASKVLRIRVLSLPFEVFNISFEAFLQAQGVVSPMLWSSIGKIVTLILLNSLFIFGLQLSYLWLVVSFVVADFCSTLILTTLAFKHTEVKRSYTGLYSVESLRGWGLFFRLGLPGAVMVCLEWWSFEILVVFAGMIGAEHAAAQAIVFQTMAIVFMIPLALSITVTSLVGNALGAKQTRRVRLLWKIALSLIIIVEVFIAVLVYFGRFLWVRAYTHDATIRRLVSSTLVITAGFVILDGMNSVLSGVLKAAGRQTFGVIVNFFAFYFVGLPMAYLLAFKFDLDTSGLMMGMTVGSTVQVLLFLVYVCLINWKSVMNNLSSNSHSRGWGERTRATSRCFSNSSK